ncbi:MAG TPA: cyclic nucleotide-binding domain-containing protein [Actinomycetota bacterium]|nr:cyclic nucleotide-binding domain-containing protein [Actinomycetota bacterium]
MARQDPVKMLAGVPIFEELSTKELKSIATASKEVTHRKGAVLAREGDSGVGFFLILDGEVSVAVGGRSLRKMGPGDFFGEISLLDGGPRTATCTAQSEVTTLGITPWTFKRLIEQNPAIASKMLKVMAQRLRSSSAQKPHY